jgi:hypothetical protein
MTYLLASVPGIEQGPEFEARANDELFARFPIVSICSFNGARATKSVLDDVLATHPILLSNGVPLVNSHYRPWPQLGRQKSPLRAVDDAERAKHRPKSASSELPMHADARHD